MDRPRRDAGHPWRHSVAGRDVVADRPPSLCASTRMPRLRHGQYHSSRVGVRGRPEEPQEDVSRGRRAPRQHTRRDAPHVRAPRQPYHGRGARARAARRIRRRRDAYLRRRRKPCGAPLLSRSHPVEPAQPELWQGHQRHAGEGKRPVRGARALQRRVPRDRTAPHRQLQAAEWPRDPSQ